MRTRGLCRGAAPLLAALAAAAAPAGARAAAAEAVPGADGVERIGGAALADDGTGAVAYLREHEGVLRAFVSRLQDGAWQAPERVDSGLEGPSGAPVVAAADGGRLVVAFENGGKVHAVLRPAGGSFGAPQALLDGGSPALGMSIFGVAYLVAAGGGDVRAARLVADRWQGYDVPLDRDPAADAGSGTGRPRVAASADGSAVAVWGEAGTVLARRLSKTAVSGFVTEAAPQSVDGRAVVSAALPEVAVQDDSSFVPVALTAGLEGGGSAAIARFLIGSQFEAPVLLAAGDAVPAPAVAANGRGRGLAAAAGAEGLRAAAFAEQRFGAADLLGAAGPTQPAVAVGRDDRGFAAWLEPGGALALRELPAEGGLAPSPLAVADAPPADPGRGLAAAADRLDDLLAAYVEAGGRRLIAAMVDRPPAAAPLARAAPAWTRARRPRLPFRPASDLWGIAEHRLEIGGAPAGSASGRSSGVRPAAALPDGRHRWRIIAIDRRGSQAASRERTVGVDATAPLLTARASLRAGRLRVSVRASDPASGIAAVLVDAGRGPAAGVPFTRSGSAVRAQALRRGIRGRRVSVTVSVRDRAGNVASARLKVRARGRTG